MNKYQASFKSFIKKNLIKNALKVKGSFPPISELIGSESKILSVKSIYNLDKKTKPFLLVVVKNYEKVPKLRYFIAKILANQSSDLLVKIAQEFPMKKRIKLLQYSIFPKLNRTSLIALVEFNSKSSFNKSKIILKELDTFFLEGLSGFMNLLNK